MMDKYIAQIEEKRARQRREMEQREGERKREMSRYIVRVEKEGKDTDEMFREIWAKTASVENPTSEKLTKATGDGVSGSCPLRAARAQSESSLTGNKLPVNSERRKQGFFRRLKNSCVWISHGND